jgi:predicted transcriptional regulator
MGNKPITPTIFVLSELGNKKCVNYILAFSDYKCSLCFDYTCNLNQHEEFCEYSMEISKAELEVLQAIWQKHPCSANEIIEILANTRNWHEKTVKTMLGRLVKKRAIDFHKDQRRYLYFPLIERNTYTQKESQSLLDRLFNGNVSPLIASFAETDGLVKEDIAELKKLIADWEKEHD